MVHCIIKQAKTLNIQVNQICSHQALIKIKINKAVLMLVKARPVPWAPVVPSLGQDHQICLRQIIALLAIILALRLLLLQIRSPIL